MVKEIEITPNEIIELDEIDLNFKEEVFELPDIDLKSLKYCFQCSTCTASCPVADAMDIMPHQIMRMLALGLKDKILKCNAIWLCVTCYNCQERCPQNVKITDILFALKNLASNLGEYPQGMSSFAKSIYKLGRSIEITDFNEDDREDLELPPVEPFDLEGVKKIFDRTGILTKLDKEEDKENLD
jgi:heterodisulfide reductase subunit C